MKKLLLMLLCGAMIFSCMTGCGAERKADAAQTPGEEPLTAVVTIFPVYDWMRELLGDRADRWNISLLAENGVDMHSYQPSVSDIARIAGCDLFIYVGGTSEDWVADALRQTEKEGRIALNLMELLGSAARTEELVEGMEAEEEEDEGEEYDEHVWLSLRNARIFCAAIAEAMTVLDPEGGKTYETALSGYDDKLVSLDEAYGAAVDAAARDTLLFGGRFPFRYLIEDYGLTYYAAFPGCSAESEASFETIAFLSGKLKELGLPAVIIPDDSDSRIADTVIRNSGGDAVILHMDSMQSALGRTDQTYLSVMEQNLTVLKTALAA